MVTFVNNANTCYFNTLLQIFLHSRIDYTSKKEMNINWYSILNKLKRLNSDTIYDTRLLYDLLKWNTKFPYGRKHDSHEALLYLIDLIDDHNFKGNIIEYMITQDSPFESDIRKIELTSLEICANYSSLEKCIDEYFKTDVITGWKDSRKYERTLLKTSCIDKTPSNLIILVRQTYRFKKNITYPLELNISKWCTSSKKVIYHLRSVVIHNNEHYYIFCRESNNWYLYNDEARVLMKNYKWMLSEAPYMLIYEIQ